MSTPDQPSKGAPQGTETTAPAATKPQGRARSAGPRPTGAAPRPKPAADAPSRAAAGSSVTGVTLKERQPDRDPETQGRLSGVAGIDRPDAFQRGRRVWPD